MERMFVLTAAALMLFLPGLHSQGLFDELREFLHPSAKGNTNPLVFPSTVTLGEGLKLLRPEAEPEAKDHFRYLKTYLPDLHRSELERISPADLQELYYRAYRAQGFGRHEARSKSEAAVE